MEIYIKINLIAPEDPVKMMNRWFGHPFLLGEFSHKWSLWGRDLVVKHMPIVVIKY